MVHNRKGKPPRVGDNTVFRRSLLGIVLVAFNLLTAGASLSPVLDRVELEIALSPGFRWGLTTLAGQPITMEDVLSETAITYPETYLATMTGSQIKDVLEDVCDNLFNADPYYQQGGDMVRVGGLAYTCTPTESVGKRISELKLGNGKHLEAGKHYKVAGWASVNQQNGAPIWDVVARHLRAGRPPNREEPEPAQ